MSKCVPSYRRHNQSGQAVVTLPDGLGRRRDVMLGAYGTKESRLEYARVIAEWEAAGRTLPRPVESADLCINELIVAFWGHAEKHYRHPDGTPTSELADYQFTLRPLKRLYGHTSAKDFGPLALKAVRQALVDGSWLTAKEKQGRQDQGKKATCCRSVANQRIGRIRRMFRWAVENELVPASVYQSLQAVRGLSKGRSQARETEPVKPVPDAFVGAALSGVLPQVAAMAQLQRHTGMRPGEVVIMRGIDLDTTGKVWCYRPARHKTAWRGHARIVPLGPKAQEILRPWLRLNVEEYLFQPREAEAQRDAERAARRKTPQSPSHRTRKRKRNPKRVAGDRYTVGSYGRAIERGSIKAHCHDCTGCRRRAKETGKEWEARLKTCEGLRAVLWNPNQLRHTKATEIRREAGLDAARAVLGHRSPAVTEVYAELDANKAAEVMERLG